MQQLNFSLINLGCTKNLVDSQYFLGRLFDIQTKTPAILLNYFTDPYDKEVNVVFLNTCGFISSGREEAEETVKKLLKANKTIYLLGCAVQYYKKLTQEGIITGVYYLSRGDLNTISLKNILEGYESKTFGDFEFSAGPRVYTNLEQKFEYLKIAEGCDNHCTFCIIPQIRGKQHSLTIEKILSEAKQMISAGVEEIILIAQDTTRYGTDLYGQPQLLELLQQLDKIEGDFSYRLLYLYPDIVTLQQIKKLKKLKKFIPYFDVPLQHISSPVLKRMGRFYDEVYIIKFLDQIKKTFPLHFIRTNFIIGFPGETKKDFEKLVKFTKKTNFNNIALFEYHDEPMASSSGLPNKVDDAEISARFDKIQKITEKQLIDHENKRKGKEETGYIMEIDKKTLIVRPRLHCPEIDTYDSISLDQIIGVFEEKDSLDIGDKIAYIV